MSHIDESIKEKIELINDKDTQLLAEVCYLSAKLIEQQIMELTYPELRIKT